MLFSLNKYDPANFIIFITLLFDFYHRCKFTILALSPQNKTPNFGVHPSAPLHSRVERMLVGQTRKIAPYCADCPGLSPSTCSQIGWKVRELASDKCPLRSRSFPVRYTAILQRFLFFLLCLVCVASTWHIENICPNEECEEWNPLETFFVRILCSRHRYVHFWVLHIACVIEPRLLLDRQDQDPDYDSWIGPHWLLPKISL